MWVQWCGGDFLLSCMRCSQGGMACLDGATVGGKRDETRLSLDKREDLTRRAWRWFDKEAQLMPCLTQQLFSSCSSSKMLIHFHSLEIENTEFVAQRLLC